jgi:galactonate dehydratase
VRITAVKGFPLRLGFRSSFIVKVETDAGIAGIGEGGMSGRELAMQGMLEHFAQILVGKDPRQIEHLWQTLYRGYYFEGGKIAGAVISAIDVALHDILGQLLGVPIYQLLGGACRERIQGFETPAALTGPECVTRAEEFVARGWRYLRFNTGMPDAGWQEGDGAIFEPQEALESAAHWIREIRRSVGPRIGLSVELHHRYSVAEAAMFCQKVADVHLLFVEEPIRAQNPEAYKQLRAMTPMPFAIGEEFANKWEFLPYIEEGLLNFARIDLANIGGFTEAKKVAGWCEAHYLDVMPHNPLGPVCTAATIHLCAAINNFAQMEHRGEKVAQFPRDLFPVFPEISGDSFALPTQPGLGVTLNEEAIEDYAYDAWAMPRWQQRDGAYTNW